MILRGLTNERNELQRSFRDAGGWIGLDLNRAALLEEILQTMADETFPGAILPRFIDGRMIFYALADTMTEWRNLQPMLRSFVGVTLTDFAGQPANLSPDDPLETLLAGYHFSVLTRFRSRGTQRLESATIDALIKLRRSFAHGHRPHRDYPRSTAQVLHEFRLALNSGDRTVAEEAIKFLRVNLRLDALNLHFLEVRCFVEFQDWNHLFGQPFFRSLCQTRRPPAITAALAETLYHTAIEPFEAADDPTGALKYFRDSLRPDYAPLFSVCPHSPRSPVTKIFLLSALTGNPPDRTFINGVKLKVQDWPIGETGFIRSLIELIPPEQPDTGLLESNDLIRQLEIAKDTKAPPTLRRARAVLLAATEVQTLEAYRVAVEYVGRLTPSDRNVLVATPGFQSIWHDISSYSGMYGVPQSWVQWARQLSYLSFSEAISCAEQATNEWPIAQQLQTPKDVEDLVTALGQAWETAEERLNGALPHLVAWIQQDERWPNSNYQPLYQCILEFLLLSPNRGGPVLGAIVTLLHSFLALGLDRSTYSGLMNDIQAIVPEVASIRSIDWLLDLGEATVTYPCPDYAARGVLWGQVSAALNQFRTRLTVAQSNLASDIATTLGVSESFIVPKEPEIDSEPDIAAFPSDLRLIAIYTLTESVGKRAQRILASLYPKLRVELLHNLVATPRLEQLARTADVVVICWTAAKHAATTLIQQKRPAGRPILLAAGGGSSSIVREIQEYIRNLGI